MIRRCGSSFRVVAYAGKDPLTGRDPKLRWSTTDERETEWILRRLVAQMDADRHAKTTASFRVAMESWLRMHEVEQTTWQPPPPRVRGRAGRPDRGTLLEEFHAELRRCGARCDGRRFVEHRTDGGYECRVVKHERRPDARRRPPHDCAAGCTLVECRPHLCTPLSAATTRPTSPGWSYVTVIRRARACGCRHVAARRC